VDYLLDTNIVTAILKQDRRIQGKLQDIRSQRQRLFMSCITDYEIKRGLLAVDATRQSDA